MVKINVSKMAKSSFYFVYLSKDETNVFILAQFFVGPQVTQRKFYT